MVTGEFKNKVDKIWEIFWTGGVTNPLSVIEQFTYLLFIKGLDDRQNDLEADAALLGIEAEQIFGKDQQELRWSHFKQLPAEQMFALFTNADKGVFAFIKNLHDDKKKKFVFFQIYAGRALPDSNPWHAGKGRYVHRRAATRQGNRPERRPLRIPALQGGDLRHQRAVPHPALIAEVQTDAFWQSANTFAYERVRIALRDLIQLLESNATIIYYTSFTDEVKAVVEGAPEYGSGEFESYRRKVEAYLRDYDHDMVVHKLRYNKELTEKDYNHLEQVLWRDLGSEEEYHKVYGDKPLLEFAAGVVGLDQDAAQSLFSDFINDQSLDRNQIEFVQLIMQYVVENGYIDKPALGDFPFNRHGSMSALFEGRMETAHRIVDVIDRFNSRVAI